MAHLKTQRRSLPGVFRKITVTDLFQKLSASAMARQEISNSVQAVCVSTRVVMNVDIYCPLTRERAVFC